MEDISLYRKYRPQSFDDVLGQDHITETIKNSLKNKTPSHAYLFSGPRGTGKTSVARILANELKTAPEDLYEIDGASNRGIDEMRLLKEGIFTLPFKSPYKVYVIDEVHMLTKEAFNALLKTLEEPPSYVIFILATTEIHKVPETIVSRCQNFIFKKPTEKILKKIIEKIAKKENVSLDDDAVSLLTFLGDGSFRDAEGYLEQVLSLSSGKTITRDEVEALTGAPSHTLVISFIKSILDKNASLGIDAIESARNKNTDMKLFTRLIMNYLRYAMLLAISPSLKNDFIEELGDAQLKEIESLAEHKGAKNFSKVLRRMIEAYEEIKYSHIPSLPLELALSDIMGQPASTRGDESMQGGDN